MIVDTGCEGMATKKNFNKRITNLSARIDAHLHQFEPMDDETDYSAVSREEKKKKNPFVRAGMAGGAVAGGVAIAANKDKLQAGYQTAKAGVQSGYGAAKSGVQAAATGAKEAGRTAAFKGMRGAADVMKKGSKVAGDVATKTSWKQQGIRKGAAEVEGVLAKGSKFLKKKSMKFFSADIAGTLVRLDAKVRRLGA